MRKTNKEEVLIECRCELLEAIREGSYEQVVEVLNWLSEQCCPKFTCSKASRGSLQQWQVNCDCSQHLNLKKLLSRVLVDCNLVHKSGRKDILPLHLSCSYSSSKIFSLLLQLHASTVGGEEALQMCDSDSGWNILHRCCYFGHLSHLKVFLEYNLDQIIDPSNKITLRRFRHLCSVVDKDGFVPLDLLALGTDSNTETLDSSVNFGVGMIVVFGSNEDFELGTGSNSFERVPRPLEWNNSSSRMEDNGKIVLVSTSHRHSLFLSKNGSVFSVGVGKDGRLGLGDVEPRLEPQPVLSPSRLNTMNQSIATQPGNVFQPESRPGFSKILASGNRSGALSRDGALYLWGDGVLKPERVEGPLRGLVILDFSFCSSHTAVVVQDGTVFCWGSNDMEQLGVEYSSVKFTNVPRLLSSLKNVICRYVYVDIGISVAIDSQGKVYFWGNGNGSPCRVILQEKATHTRKKTGRKIKAKKVVFLVKKKCLLILSEGGHVYEFFYVNRLQSNRQSPVATRALWTARILLSDLASQDSECVGLDLYGRVITWSFEDEIPRMTMKSDLRMVSFLSISGRHGFAGIKMPILNNASKMSPLNRNIAPSLQELCENKLKSSISLDSVIPLLSIAFKLGIESVVESCVDFILYSLDAILCFFPQTFAGMEYEVVSLLERHWKEKWKRNIVTTTTTTERFPEKTASKINWSYRMIPRKESIKEIFTIEDSSKPLVEVTERPLVLNRETVETYSKDNVGVDCTESTNSSAIAIPSLSVSTEGNKQNWTSSKRRENMKLVFSSAVIHREPLFLEKNDKLPSPSKASSVKLSLKDAIRLEDEKKRNCWKTETHHSYPSSSLNAIQMEQLKEMSKDEWSSICLAPTEFSKLESSCGQTESHLYPTKGRQLRVSSPSIPIRFREASNYRSDSIMTVNPAWSQESKFRNESFSFRDIMNEEEKKKDYFSKSLSPSSLSPLPSKIWKKLPSEEPVMVKPLKKIETEELALKTIRKQYPSAEVKRAPYIR